MYHDIEHMEMHRWAYRNEHPKRSRVEYQLVWKQLGRQPQANILGVQP